MQCAETERPPGLKPALIVLGVRGPEGPLFHGHARIREFFRMLFSRAAQSRKMRALAP
jgi:hypothetical protein